MNIVLYDPKSFIVLKNWLEIFFSKSVEPSADYLKIAKNIDENLFQFLVEQDLPRFLSKVLLNSKNPAEIEKQKHYWFDAFRTLKLIHYLRDETYTNINMFDAIDELLKMMNIENNILRNSAIPDLEIQKEYLLLLRKIQS